MIYTPEKGKDPYVDIDKLITKENEPTIFHIGQCYEKKPARKLYCAKCGSDEFNVGQGNHFTAIRCPKCEWELCIHDG